MDGLSPSVGNGRESFSRTINSSSGTNRCGKTLSSFLPSLIDLAHTPRTGLHTLYLSPIKALAVDIARNLETPISEMGLPVSVETRTGDTPQAKRKRQRSAPPNMLMTTPESSGIDAELA